MTIRRRLTSIVLVGALTLGTAMCGVDNSQYKYSGQIGEDQVTFEDQEGSFGLIDDNILTAIKPDGRIIKYVDKTDDLKLEYVEITAKNQTTKYTANDEVGKPILEEAQKQFDAYMQHIKETRTNQGLENLK
ncbi:MAG: hypothetical protein KKF67_00255 [Nanoarchaeota archaeon]|nr:hypothetical protein [Nanoarchaeota archaeon]